jgi:hypothetical protein
MFKIKLKATKNHCTGFAASEKVRIRKDTEIEILCDSPNPQSFVASAAIDKGPVFSLTGCRIGEGWQVLSRTFVELRSISKLEATAVKPKWEHIPFDFEKHISSRHHGFVVNRWSEVVVLSYPWLFRDKHERQFIFGLAYRKEDPDNFVESRKWEHTGKAIPCLPGVDETFSFDDLFLVTGVHGLSGKRDLHPFLFAGDEIGGGFKVRNKSTSKREWAWIASSTHVRIDEALVSNSELLIEWQLEEGLPAAEGYR